MNFKKQILVFIAGFALLYGLGKLLGLNQNNLEALFIADKVVLYSSSNPSLFKTALLTSPSVPSALASVFGFFGSMNAALICSSIFGATLFLLVFKISMTRKSNLRPYVWAMFLINPVILFSFGSGGITYWLVFLSVVLFYNLFLFAIQGSLGKLSYASLCLANILLIEPSLLIIGIMLLPVLLLWSVGRGTKVKIIGDQIFELQENPQARKEVGGYLRDALLSFYILPVLAFLFSIIQAYFSQGQFSFSGSSAVTAILAQVGEVGGGQKVLLMLLFNLAYLAFIPFFYKNTLWLATFVLPCLSAMGLLLFTKSSWTFYLLALPSLVFLASILAAYKSGVRIETGRWLPFLIGIDMVAKVVFMVPMSFNHEVLIKPSFGLGSIEEGRLIKGQRSLLKTIKRKGRKTDIIKADPSMYFPLLSMINKPNRIDRSGTRSYQADLLIFHQSELQKIESDKEQFESFENFSPKQIDLDGVRSLSLVLISDKNHLYKLEKDSVILGVE